MVRYFRMAIAEGILLGKEACSAVTMGVLSFLFEA
jgi:hypothetical protein